jgi:uncharacterized membrane protein YfhO
MSRYVIDLAWTTALVVAVAAVISRYFWLYGKSTVWRTDGLGQHYPALYAFNEWVRGFLSSPGAGLPLWSWNMGLGADIIGTLAFPVVGDPFALLSLAFPMNALEHAYMALLAVRIVAASVAAAVYFRKMGARPMPAAIGVVLHVFATFLLIQGRHPYFINAMVFLPLLLLGIELALRDRKTWPLALFAFLAAMANFYFFYMLTIITVLYAVARYFELTDRDERWKRVLPTIARVGGHYAMGTALAAPLLLPALAAVLSTARSSSEFDVGVFYPVWVYRSLIAAMASGEFGAQSSFFGWGYLAWLMVPILFLRRRSHSALKFMIAAFAVFVAVPWFGSMFNGFTFPSNRFAFAWGLFLALGVALVLSEEKPLSRRDVIAATAVFAAYAIPIWALVRPVPVLVSAPMGAGLLTLCALAIEPLAAARATKSSPTAATTERQRRPLTLWVLLGLVVANVVLNGTLLHDKRFEDMLHDFERLGGVQQRFDRNLGSVVRDLPKDDFYRVENSSPVELNSAMVHGYAGTSFYFSTMNGFLTEFRKEIDSRPGWSSFTYDGFDQRVMPTTLVSTRYYLAKSTPGARGRVPYGFRLERQTSKGDVYVNEYALPIAFVYERAIDRSDYLRLEPVDRQAAMLQGAVVEDGVAPEVARIAPSREAIELPFSVLSESGADLDVQAGRIVRACDQASFVLSITPVTDAELYVEMRDIDNLDRRAAQDGTRSGVAALIGRVMSTDRPARALPTQYVAGDVRKVEMWRSPVSQYYWGDRSQLVNLGYQRGAVTTIGIEPELMGTQTFESLKVLALPLEDYPVRVEALRANPMRDIEFGTNRLSGRVTASRDSLLFLSIPFTSGWSATLDGEPVDIVRANTGFSAVHVSEGEHEVVLRYFTPGLCEGLLVGALALLGIAVSGTLAARSRRRAAA